MKVRLFKVMLTVNCLANFEYLCFTDAINAQKSKPLIKILKKLGGWPLVTKNLKNEKSPKELVKLALKDFSTKTLLKFEIAKDVKNISNYVINVKWKFIKKAYCKTAVLDEF